jgi:hypothetical protein
MKSAHTCKAEGSGVHSDAIRIGRRFTEKGGVRGRSSVLCVVHEVHLDGARFTAHAEPGRV